MKRFLLVLFLLVGVQGQAATVKLYEKNVATASTPERIRASNTLCYGFTVRAKAANTGNILFKGDNTGHRLTLDAGEQVTIGDIEIGGNERAFNLYTQYIDATVNGEGAEIICIAPDSND